MAVRLPGPSLLYSPRRIFMQCPQMLWSGSRRRGGRTLVTISLPTDPMQHPGCELPRTFYELR